MHEHRSHHAALVQSSSNRSFGFVFTVFFAVVGLLPLLRGNAAYIWSIALSLIFFLLALVAPFVLAPANRAWTKFGAILHQVVSPLALGILFLCVFTPIGLLMRLFGKDPLRLQFEPSAKTYWIERTPPGPDAESLKNQF